MKVVLVALVALMTLSGCTQSTSFGEFADGPCSGNQGRLVQEHIGAQITALSQEDWKDAYSYASSGFQEAVTLAQFTRVIQSQYGMLINSESTEFGSCTIATEKITQQVRVASQSENFELRYELSYLEQSLGIESAAVMIAGPEVNT